MSGRKKAFLVVLFLVPFLLLSPRLYSAYQHGLFRSPVKLKQQLYFFGHEVLDLRYAPLLLVDRIVNRPEYPHSLDYRWIRYHLVAHALGAIGTMAMTESRDAFLHNYHRGFRVFEVDLIRTSDGRLIAKHDWYAEGGPLPYASFMASRIKDRYTAIDMTDLLRLLEQYQDSFLIIDAKEDISAVLPLLVAGAQASGSGVLDRIVPQIYSEADLIKLNRIYPFKSLVYTLYRTKATDASVVDFVRRNGIRAVTMARQRFSRPFASALAAVGAATYVHTVNDAAEAAFFRQHGAHGFYTDFLLPGKPSS